MKKIFLILSLSLVLSLIFSSCDGILILEPEDLEPELTETVEDTTQKQETTEKKTEASSEDTFETSDTTEEIEEPFDVRIKYDLSNVVKGGGTVSKKHDPTIQVWSETMGDYRVHLGIDIECRENAEVYSVIDGEVSKIWEDSLMGVCVAIQKDDVIIIYKNLENDVFDCVREGQKIDAYSIIGHVGNTAMVELADATHLHLEITVDGLQVDPMRYIEDGNGDLPEWDTESDTDIDFDLETDAVEPQEPEVEICFSIDGIVDGGGTVSKKHDPTIQVWSETMGDYRVHLGIDIECRENAEVYSVIDGEVSKIWEDALMGVCVAIKKANVLTIYKNLENDVFDYVREGQEIDAHSVIGHVGNTAIVELADAIHLHLEITVGDMQVDPMDFIE